MHSSSGESAWDLPVHFHRWKDSAHGVQLARPLPPILLLGAFWTATGGEKVMLQVGDLYTHGNALVDPSLLLCEWWKGRKCFYQGHLCTYVNRIIFLAKFFDDLIWAAHLMPKERKKIYSK